MSASNSHRRPRYRPSSSHPAALMDEAHGLLDAGRLNDAIDIYELLSKTPGVDAVAVLAELFDVYKCIRSARFDRYTLYQSRLFDFEISPAEKVLDVGSGHHPFPLATHLSDISATDDQYGRAGIPFKHVEGKPVYEFDIEEIPFGEGEFDFTYCSHVLEHTKDPGAACRELMRVSRRGYIETPTASNDLWLGIARPSNHTVSVELHDEDFLVFRPYSPEEIEGIGSDILLQMHVEPQSPREKAFSSLVYLHPDRINTMLYWERRFRYRIQRSPLESIGIEPPTSHPPSAPEPSRGPAMPMGTPHGGWRVLAHLLDRNSTVYCAGIHEDIRFELDLIESTGARLHAFDPDPRVAPWLESQRPPPNLQHFGIGLSTRDGTESYPPPPAAPISIFRSPPPSGSTFRAPVARLASLTDRFRHDRIDLLKLDIPSEECDIVEDMLRSGIFPKQLLIGFHHGLGPDAPPQGASTVRKLEESGYKLFHLGDDSRRACFVHREDPTEDARIRDRNHPVRSDNPDPVN